MTVDTVAMILRVWALYSRSRFILYVLLTIYAIEVMFEVASRIVFTTQNQPMGMWNIVSYYAHYITGYSLFSRPHSAYRSGP